MKRFFFSSRMQLISITFLVLLLHLLQIIWIKQDAFTHPYDVSYWRDRIEHSQWQLPASKRIIGDDGLFAYVGYRLVEGADFTFLNPETGPVGKYLLGFSILFTHTPATVSFLLGIGVLLLLYFLSLLFLKDTLLSLLLTVLFSFDPLFYSQVTGSWIDLPQLFFLLLFFVLLFYGLQKKYSSLFFLGSGIALGLFTAVKFPVLMPVLVFISLIVAAKSKQWQLVLLILVGFCCGFLLPYCPYLLHHSLREFLSLQKYIAAFYLKSQLKANHAALWLTLLLGKFPDIVSGKLLSYAEWWIVLPVVTIMSIGSGIWMMWKKYITLPLMAVSFYIFSACLIFSFIPFYPRYILLILPFFYLVTFYAVTTFSKKTAFISLVICIFVGVVTSMFYLAPHPQSILSNLSYNLSHGYFQDIYEEDIDNPYSTGLSREAFRSIAQKAFLDAEIVQVDIKQGKPRIIGSKMQIPITEIYHTRRLGEFREQKVLSLIQLNGAWKVQWNWNLVFNGFVPGDTIKEDIVVGKRGTIQDSKGNIIAEDSNGYLVSVIPSQIDTKREQEMLELFAQLSSVKAVKLQNDYLENPLANTPIPLFSSFTVWDENIVQKLKSYPGVVISTYPSRIYTTADPQSIDNTSSFEECCSRIYSSSTYHGISGAEKQYDKVLAGQDGGSLVLYDRKGIVVRAIVSRPPRDGRDVTVAL